MASENDMEGALMLCVGGGRIAEKPGWKGKHDNQPNHTAAVKVELLFEANEGSHGWPNIGADPRSWC